MDVLDYLKSLDAAKEILTVYTSIGRKHEYSSLQKSDISFEIDDFIHIKQGSYDDAIKIDHIVSIEISPNPNVYDLG